MNTSDVILGLMGVAVIGGIAYTIGKRREDEPEPAPAAPPGYRQRTPGVGRLPTPPAMSPLPPGSKIQLPDVPPSGWEIPGGTYIAAINAWCPPGYVYDLATGMCSAEAFVTTQGVFTKEQAKAMTGACCGSCAIGGECEGCDGR